MATAEVATTTYLCLELAGTLMEPEEFDAVEEFDDLYRYELINGVLIVTPLPLDSEVGPNEILGHWLCTYQEQHPLGAALDATLAERHVRTRANRRRADRLIWTGLGRLPQTRVDLPSIVAEFVSFRRRDSRRDYQEKQREYMQAGIREYWIVDRFRRVLTVWRNSPQGPQQLVVPEQHVYTTPLLPGFELPLARLLAVADRWTQSEE